MKDIELPDFDGGRGKHIYSESEKDNVIKELLDRLDEYYAQKTVLEMDRRKLLDQVKVPAEVEAVVNDGMAKMREIDANMQAAMKNNNAKLEAELAKIVIPDEIKAALAEIDRQRAEAMARSREGNLKISSSATANKARLEAEIKQKTKDVYDQIEQRKREIEAEFGDKFDSADENIQKLEAAIKKLVREFGKSVKAKHYNAVYTPGRITWNTDKMEAWRHDYPFLDEARKEGEAFVTLRRI